MAAITMTRGRLAEAERHWRTQIKVSTVSGSSGRRLFGALQLAYLELRYHSRPARARAIVDSVLALRPLDSMLPGDRRCDELARFYAELGDVAQARALLNAADANNRKIGRLWAVDSLWAQGVIALKEGRVRSAETALRSAADCQRCTICVLPDLARAYEAAGKVPAAIATYETYLASPWLWRYENDAVELGFTLKRLGELYEQRHEKAKAAAAYTKLLQLWSRADGEAARMREDVQRRLRTD